MSDGPSSTEEGPSPDSGSTLDAGTYEILRGRLAEQAAELSRRAELLNTRRLEVFGSSELRLLGTERIRTEHNCVPRDIVAVGGLMMFGYNVFIGLKPETTVSDVFATYSFERKLEGDGFRFVEAEHEELPGLLADSQFLRDFGELYRYYKDTRLMQLRRVEGKLLAVFQIGLRTDDTRVLRWAVTPRGEVSYRDNRGDRDHVFPAPHDFTWVETTREDHVLGRHPHISILDKVFVETVGGDLTVKVENNTEVGAGIYSEPVDEPLQSLADADVHYAEVGPLILIRIRPYNETTRRHLVFNTRTNEVVRLDGIGRACRRLPEDQGIIFPGGYYLATGASTTFDTDFTDLEFERTIRSPNGEDVLYAFHGREEGRSLLLPYNVIRKEVANPIDCHGYSLFDDGTLVLFRSTSDEPTRVHPLQVWSTPFVSDVHAAAQPTGTGPLERVGNADLVRGISDALSITRMVDEMSPSTAVFEALIAACRRIGDHYHWLGEEELEALAEPVQEVRATARQVLEEFENVQALTRQAAEALETAETEIASLVRRARSEDGDSADAWVTLLAEVRRAQGRVVTLGEMRYVDGDRVADLGRRLSEELDATGQRAVDFLRREEAFAAYHVEVRRLSDDAEAITSVAAAEPVAERLAEQTEGLEVVTEVIDALDIGDAQVRTAVLERIGEVAGAVNRARAALGARRRELMDSEGRAEFAAEFALLGQAVTAALAAADTPDACDDQLGRLMLRLENLESRFAEFDDFLADLTAKREDVYEALSARKQALLDERSRRADRLASSSERILSGVRRRAAALETIDDINTYFASDPMVAKLRSTAEELRALGDTVRAEELDGRVKTVREEAGRALRDRVDLYDDGGETLRLGRHRFAVNTQPIDLTMVPHQGEMAITVTGTDFRQPVRDADFQETRAFWERLLVSESPEVYRAEYLAAGILADAEAGVDAPSIAELSEAALGDGDALSAIVRGAAEARYDEGYERGVHDHDAALILRAVLRLRAAAGPLRHAAQARAAARLFWAFGAEPESRTAWQTRSVSLARARDVFGPRSSSSALGALHDELADAVGQFLDSSGVPTTAATAAGTYLVEELAQSPTGFGVSAEARSLLDGFRYALGGPTAAAYKEFTSDLAALGGLAERHQLASAWMGAYTATLDGATPPREVVDEAVAVELCGTAVPRYDSSAELTATVEGVLGAHPRISERRVKLRLDEFLERTRRSREEDAPAFRAYLRRRNELVEAERSRLRLEEYTPKVMSGFVRNRLLDESYLPLIGDNLAKQLGATGDGKRTDNNGLLLLISPPGYGKTTLMEYVASRLGLVFVKVNGPALGHAVTSLDPADAPDATARQEVEKIGFALEMGSNVLLYLDDIQHTNPELLQKFISLCDGQRRMEGVWEGRTRTYDMRGKRFAVCMAGNPYTEQGQRFRIPDMLANRADVYNLGDVLSGKDDVFALSYIENALAANTVLAPLSGRDRGDIELLVRMASGDGSVHSDRLSHPYSQVELEQILAVLRKLLRVQQVVLAVNQAYIASAAQSDDARTEPPFQLQGSYRNMNRLAERVVPVMNEAELEALIDDHYLGEAQTLTAGAEANLLKLAELRGTLTPEQEERWTEVKSAYLRTKALGGDGEDPVSRAIGAVGLLADRVGDVQSAIERASDRPSGSNGR
nr:DNA repair ATPase [Spiractinospora alimapuensis]